MPPRIIGTRQPLAHVRPVACAKPTRWASGSRTNSSEEADEAVDEDEGADELAGLVAGAGLPEHEPEEQEHQHDALEHGLVELARMARDLAAGREDDAPGQGWSVAPHSSPFTKLASRPRNRPGGMQQAT